MAQPISRTEYEKLASFRYALRQFLRFSETAAREAGITPRQHQALLAIAGHPGREEVMMSELAERLQLRHHTTVELIDAWRRRNWSFVNRVWKTGAMSMSR